METAKGEMRRAKTTACTACCTLARHHMSQKAWTTMLPVVGMLGEACRVFEGMMLHHRNIDTRIPIALPTITRVNRVLTLRLLLSVNLGRRAASILPVLASEPDRVFRALLVPSTLQLSISMARAALQGSSHPGPMSSRKVA